MIYFGFAIADGMFPESVGVSRSPLRSDEVRRILGKEAVSFCLNPSHEPTIKAARQRFGLDVQVPAKAPNVFLKAGDSLIVMSVRDLPRLEGRHEYTEEEIEKASFKFGVWTVQD